MDPTFTDAEKRFVLAEIIKASSLDVSILVDLAKHHNIEPEWLSMQVPNGRNLGQCIKATEALFDRSMQYPNLKRKPIGNLVEIAPKRQAIEQPRSLAIPRAIHPRPSSNGYISTPSPTVIAPPITGKKRGRPSKAEKAEKEAQLLRASTQLNVSAAPHGQPVNYTPGSAGHPQASMASLPSISTIPDYAASPSPATAYNVVSGPADETNSRRGRERSSLNKHQSESMLQESRPCDSNAHWKAGVQDIADTSHQDLGGKTNFPTQPRQMASPMEPRQLPSLSESIPSTLIGRLSAASEHSNSPASQHKPGSHSPHLNPAPAALVP